MGVLLLALAILVVLVLVLPPPCEFSGRVPDSDRGISGGATSDRRWDVCQAEKFSVSIQSSAHLVRGGEKKKKSRFVLGKRGDEHDVFGYHNAAVPTIPLVYLRVQSTVERGKTLLLWSGLSSQ